MTALNDVHVLIVDDNRQMRLLVRCLLRAGGLINISEAETAAQAIEAMRERQVDLVIVDWMMQPVDGLSFTRMMRADSASPNPYMPILMLTAHTEASRVAAARDAGVTGFIKKPISARLLFDRVASALTDTRIGAAARRPALTARSGARPTAVRRANSRPSISTICASPDCWRRLPRASRKRKAGASSGERSACSRRSRLSFSCCR
jgi:CheY-like chemotaxis protein